MRMNPMKRQVLCLLVAATVPSACRATGETNIPPPAYHIYAGSTHAHTAFTWSHGDQFAKNGCTGIQVYAADPASPIAFTWSDGYVKSTTGCAGIYVINSFQYPSPSVTVKPDWKEYQGTPSDHFSLAKSHGYDFYVTSDHSQEAAFQPASATNPMWVASKQAAVEASGG